MSSIWVYVGRGCDVRRLKFDSYLPHLSSCTPLFRRPSLPIVFFISTDPLYLDEIIYLSCVVGLDGFFLPCGQYIIYHVNVIDEKVLVLTSTASTKPKLKAHHGNKTYRKDEQ